MKVITHNGVLLVHLGSAPTWLIPLVRHYEYHYHCDGCYFNTEDVQRVVSPEDYPSKQINPDYRSCDLPPEVQPDCYWIPKAYYERHKPK